MDSYPSDHRVGQQSVGHFSGKLPIVEEAGDLHRLFHGVEQCAQALELLRRLATLADQQRTDQR